MYPARFSGSGRIFSSFSRNTAISWGVMWSAANRNARPSRTARRLYISTASSCLRLETIVPRRGVTTMSASCSSMRKASRTGVRLTPSCLANCVSNSRSPEGRCPRKMAVRSFSCTMSLIGRRSVISTGVSTDNLHSSLQRHIFLHTVYHSLQQSEKRPPVVKWHGEIPAGGQQWKHCLQATRPLPAAHMSTASRWRQLIRERPVQRYLRMSASIARSKRNGRLTRRSPWRWRWGHRLPGRALWWRWSMWASMWRQTRCLPLPTRE